jgi:transcriptional regulator with XRE-family HTH domain
MVNKIINRNQKPQPETGQFGDAIQDAMAKQGKSIQDLANALEVTYEHARRLVKGMAFPSKPILKEVCKYLSLNVEQMNQSLVADKLKHKYGTVPQKIYGANPKLERITQNLLKLNDEQFDMVSRMVESAARASGRA